MYGRETTDRYERPSIPRVVSRAEALRFGYSRRAIAHRLDRGAWNAILPSTYLTVDTLTWSDRLVAALSFAGSDSVLSGAAGLCDLGIQAVRRPERVLVLVPRSTGVRTREWVDIRRTRRLPDAALLPGPRRAPVARAVADLALQTRHLDDVRTVLAQAVRQGLCTLPELVVELQAGPQQGSGNLRRAIAEISDGAWSAPEARAAHALRAAGVGEFEQNVRIATRRGRTVVADFLWRRLRAILEIDSVEHHLDPADWRATMDRHLLLATIGYSVVHRTPADVRRDPVRFGSEIAAWLQTLAARQT